MLAFIHMTEVNICIEMDGTVLKKEGIEMWKYTGEKCEMLIDLLFIIYL